MTEREVLIIYSTGLWIRNPTAFLRSELETTKGTDIPRQFKQVAARRAFFLDGRMAGGADDPLILDISFTPGAEL
jgi:hypothetical protein